MTTAPDAIGKYRVLAKLGQGGMARVLLTVAAGKAGFEKLLVVKELREELAHDAEFLTMFLDEARLAARLNHPHVVHTYEVGQDGDRHFIAMDYLEGQSLVTILRKVGRGGLPLALHVRVLSDMLEGLHYAHTLTDFDGTPLKVVHRDVSPHNVFVTYDGQVKVVDFGIAKAVGAAGHTKTGVYKGKAGYIAPEQAKADPIDARADVFAVGVMLWEALAQRRMASAETDIAVLAMRIGGLDPKVREVVPDAPPALADACDRAMAPAAADRFPDAAAMREALEAWLDAQPERAGPKELGAFVSKAFAEERAALRARIDEQLKRVRESSQGGAIPVLDIAPLRSPSDTPTPSREDAETVQASNLSARRRAEAERDTRGRSWPMLVGAAVAAAAVAVFALRTDEPSPGAPSPSTAPSAEADATVLIQIDVEPSDAVVTLDGAVLSGRPFRGRFPKDGKAHALEATAPGFVTERRFVGLDTDHELRIRLAPEAPVAAPSSSPSAAASATTPPAPARRGGGGPAPRPTGAPGAKHDIDEQNPYGR